MCEIFVAGTFHNFCLSSKSRVLPVFVFQVGAAAGGLKDSQGETAARPRSVQEGREAPGDASVGKRAGRRAHRQTDMQIQRQRNRKTEREANK